MWCTFGLIPHTLVQYVAVSPPLTNGDFNAEEMLDNSTVANSSHLIIRTIKILRGISRMGEVVTWSRGVRSVRSAPGLADNCIVKGL